MAYYRSVGEVPPKRHTQFRQPDGELYYEELMGEEGFSSDSSLLYHRGVPSAIVDARSWELPDLATDAEPPAHAAAPQAARAVPRATDGRRATPSTGRRLVLGNADVRISYVVAGDRPVAALPQRDRRRVRLCRGGHGTVETMFGVLDATGPGDYVHHPAGHGHRWVPGDEPLRALRDRGQLPHHAAQALPVQVRPAARARAVLRARPARPRREPLLVEGKLTSRSTSSTAGTARPGVVGSRVDLRHPPVRRRRLGRLPLPVHVQRRGLRADHRPGAPAAAGAPGVRGLQLRGLQLRAAQGRLPPAGRSRCPTTTPTSTPTR